MQLGPFGMHAAPDAEAAFRMVAEQGVIPLGDWFWCPRGWPILHQADGDDWTGPLDGVGSPWKPVGGPAVSANLTLTAHWVEIRFDQEAHPYGRFDVNQISIGYQAKGGGRIRIFGPNPRPVDRTRIALYASVGEESFQLFVPGEVTP